MSAQYPGIDSGLTSETDYTGDGSVDSAWTLQSLGIETILKGDDINYIQRKFGFGSIIISVFLLIYLITTMSLCGLAPFDVNPTVGPYPDALSGCGAKNIFSIWYDQQYWRFLTAPLMSVGLLHLVCNTAILLETGAQFEREWGTFLWIIIFICSGIGATIFSSIFNPETVSVASSGAIMGLFGAKFSQFILSIFNLEQEDNLDPEILASLICTFFFTLLLAIFPYVDVSGHFGGLVAGVLSGIILLSRSTQAANSTKLLWIGVGTIMAIVFLVGGVIRLGAIEIDPNLADPCYYFENMLSENYDCTCSS